jgi:aminoglycoside phosphotransferase (APT) family kinase protein
VIDPKRLATEIAVRYLGRTPDQVTTVSRLNSLVLRLRFADGSAKVLKCARTADAAGLRKETAVHSRLARHGVPGPVTEHADFSAAPPWILMASAGYRTVLDAASEPLAAEMGRALARVHGVPAEGLRLSPSPPATPAEVARLAAVLEPRRVVPAGSAATLARLPVPVLAGEALCHGDFHAVHCVLGADGAIAAVVDWGNAWRGNPLVDLAVAHAYFDYYAPHLAAPLLAGYGEVRPLPTDFRAGYLAVRMAHALGLAHVFLAQRREANVVRAGALVGEYLREAGG